MSKTNPARGTRDFLPADIRKREYVISIIKEVYESYGFEPLETPAVENIETLMGKYGEEGNQLIFKILKRGEKLDDALASETPQSAKLPSLIRRGGSEADGVVEASPQSLSDLALRYDLTVPLARVIANRKNDLPKFFKRYQIQPVWRADRPARGRYREFYQCDVDAIGSSSMVVEAELISAVSEILSRLGFDNYVVRVNHRAILKDILEFVRIEESMHGEVLVTIDKLDKTGARGVEQELKRKGISPEQCNALLQFFDTKKDKQSDIVGHLIQVVTPEVMSQFQQLVTLCGDLPVEIDPSLARGLSYYTGTIMEINVPDLAGSLGGGGRYDGLIGMFGKEQIPACGFSLGLERILVVMDERGMFPPEIAESAPADVMVTIWSEETASVSLKLASELRSAGLRVTLYPEADKLGKQIKYADSINVPWVCIIGESELAEGKVTLKNMKSGEQETADRKDAAARLRDLVSS